MEGVRNVPMKEEVKQRHPCLLSLVRHKMLPQKDVFTKYVFGSREQIIARRDLLLLKYSSERFEHKRYMVLYVRQQCDQGEKRTMKREM